MVTKDKPQEENPWEILKNSITEELERSRRDVKEIELMLEQSQLEVNKLAQRNASISTHLQQVQGQFDSMPRADIRMAYDSALDAQQRLFVMRGQLEKLQSDHNHLKNHINTIEGVLKSFEGGGLSGPNGHGSLGTTDTVEMLIQAQESERQRLSRQMHDGPAQALSNFILQTEIAMRLFDIDQSKARDELSNLKSAATNTFQKIRDFIFELRPMMLDDLGLVPTLKRYFEALKDHASGEIRLLVSGIERRMEPYIEVMLFRAVQELINNSVRHSQASMIKVQVDMGDSNVRVVVDDNGKGFDTKMLDERSSMGLKVIRDRVEMLGGYMDIDSNIGQGTRVTFQVPAPDVMA